ncbi:MAG: hypothetical protein LC746_07670 [Acidobacteria bacterium]|nr:hypothetical protein [Acidobacteriota bacterium]
MLKQLLPRSLDNTYRGNRLALWLFGLVTLMRTFQSLVVIFDSYSTAVRADGIPLDSYPHDAAQTIAAIFALSGLSRLIISLVCVVVLVRYRSAVSFMLAVVLLNYLAAQVLLKFVPIVRVGSPPASVVNLTLLALTLVGFVLSLWRRKDAPVLS